MGNVTSHYPDFRTYGHLLKEQPNAEIAAINEWYFEHLTKCCLLSGGFMPFIRKQEGDTLFVKLYYLEERVKENKRAVEQFVASFYFHEKYNVKYTRCNIIRIPLQIIVEESTIQQLSSVREAEALLQWQLQEDSWIGVDYTGSEGGLNIPVDPDPKQYELSKQALLNGALTVCFEKRMHQKARHGEYTVINRLKEGYKISVKKDEFILGWETQGKENIKHSVDFIWNGINFTLTGLGYYGQKSTTIQADLRYFNQTTRFGFGRSTLGAGAVGHVPEIIVGNKKLKFSFGNNWISVSEIAVGPCSEIQWNKASSSFEFVL